MNETLQPQHEWLQQFVGAWSYEAEADMGDGQPPSKASGIETVRSLGGFWVVAEGQGEVPGGGPATTLLTIGYDIRQERYVGSWVGSMMSWHCVYTKGWLEPDGKTLVLEVEGPSFADPAGTATYRDSITFDGPDQRVMTSSVLTGDGSWKVFMTARYRRTG